MNQKGSALIIQYVPQFLIKNIGLIKNFVVFDYLKIMVYIICCEAQPNLSILREVPMTFKPLSNFLVKLILLKLKLTDSDLSCS